jgi:hypothetical protein
VHLHGSQDRWESRSTKTECTSPKRELKGPERECTCPKREFRGPERSVKVQKGSAEVQICPEFLERECRGPKREFRGPKRECRGPDLSRVSRKGVHSLLMVATRPYDFGSGIVEDVFPREQ